MNFLLFFVYFIFSFIILLFILFILYKLFFKKLITTVLSERAILSAFDSFNNKSILDIKSNTSDKEEKDEKIPTYF